MISTVVNLSDFILTETQTEVLGMGLNFIPTPPCVDGDAIQESVRKFTRQMHLRYFFHGSQKTKEIEKFTNKSTWEPPVKEDSIVTELDDLQNCIAVVSTPNNQGINMTKRQINAIKSLKENKDIIIKPADKGSATVVMSTNNYIGEANRQLANALHYAPANETIAPRTAAKLSSVLNTLQRKGYISRRQLNYLKPPTAPRNRQLYLLPKIHKDPDKWPQKERMPPGRPIISDCGSESYKVSEYIDEFLCPLAINHPSYVKDTTDFIDKITSLMIPADAMLFTMDVESLYTNIDNTSGLEAVKRAFTLTNEPDRPDAEILDLLSISLNNNVFQFHGNFYKQIWGTAMGQKYATNYANLFMAQWEKHALQKCPNKPIIYLRYLDDIFGIWTHGEVEFDKFISILNAHQTNINLTSETSYQEINFLDTTIFKGDRFSKEGILDSKVFFKATDTHQLLHKKSFHPKHTFSGIVKSQILRFHRICNNTVDFEAATAILFHSLGSRGYSRRFLRSLKVSTLYDISNNHRHDIALRCGGDKCDTCEMFTEFTPCGVCSENASLKRNTCMSTNIVYLIHCDRCDNKYVGETGNTLRDRMNQHRSDTRNRKNTPVAKHFNKDGHTMQDLRVTILESGPFSPDAELDHIYRRNKESIWIDKLKTAEPRGMNAKKIAYNIIPFVIPYSNRAGEIVAKTRTAYRKLQRKFPRIFTTRFIAAYSRNKNLKEMVVTTTLK